ncbi:MAG: hypothetical protein EAZ57_05475 [Cytophagales bacterium]|nr:MAG: hypothetical protein EAZ57_05475 [Cytophagales bacterium]
MFKIKSSFLLCFLFIWISACTPTPPEGLDTKSVARDVQYRKLRRIKEPEVLEAASLEGRSIIKELEATQENPKNGFLVYQNKDTVLKIAREVAFWSASSEGMASEEKMLLEAYKSLDFSKEPPTENLQISRTDPNLIFYTFPKVLKDSAQMLGFWSIRINKQDLLKKHFWNIPKGFRKK